MNVAWSTDTLWGIDSVCSGPGPIELVTADASCSTSNVTGKHFRFKSLDTLLQNAMSSYFPGANVEGEGPLDVWEKVGN